MFDCRCHFAELRYIAAAVVFRRAPLMLLYALDAIRHDAYAAAYATPRWLRAFSFSAMRCAPCCHILIFVIAATMSLRRHYALIIIQADLRRYVSPMLMPLRHAFDILLLVDVTLMSYATRTDCYATR